MARVTLSEEAIEKSTYVCTLTFTDAAGDPVTPTTVTWSLSNTSGTILNSRSAVVATPGTTVTIVLSGADLALQAGETTAHNVHRLLTVQATYSSTEGAGLPLNEEAVFALRPLAVVA